MKLSDIATMLTVTVIGGVLVYVIRRRLDGDPLTFNAVFEELDQEEEEGVYV